MASLWISSGALLMLFELFRMKNLSLGWIIAGLIPAVYIGAMIANILTNLFSWVAGFETESLTDYFFLASLYFYIPLTLVLVFYGIGMATYEARKEKEHALQSESLAREARWQMLRYQVNPHFLFNALNSIRALISKDQDLARDMVTELSDYFRHTLAFETQTEVALIEEWKAVRNFLEIQRIRFQKDLEFNMNLDPSLREIKIPLFGLQTLVENAVKYGLKTSTRPVKILIEGFIKGEQIVLQVKNTGQLISAEAKESSHDRTGSKTGLKNLKDRLALDHGSNARFSLTEDKGWVIATIEIRRKDGYS